METRVIITKRFRKNSRKIYEYLLQQFSAEIAFDFLSKIEEKIELIAAHPRIGKPSKKVDIRSCILEPYNLLYYRYQKDRIEILCLFDMRANPTKKPY
jgi:plasmid stabilization system protein ParE